MAGPVGVFCTTDKNVCLEITFANESNGEMKGTLKENGYHYPATGWYKHVRADLTNLEFTTENSGIKDKWIMNSQRPSFSQIWGIRSFKTEDGSEAANEYTLKKQ